MSIAKNFGAKVAATLIMALAACLLSANVAFAQDFTVSCTASNSTDGTAAISETIDIDEVIGSGTAVYGMYYKSNAWNVLATNQYATFEDVVGAALEEYNSNHSTHYDYDDVVWNSTGKMTLTVMEDNATEASTYTKYYPTLADMTTRLSFYGNATNSTTTLTNATHTNVGAVFTKYYGSKATASGAYASSAATNALANQASATYPRLITGCEDNMTTSTAMGKRYPYGIVGISF